MKEFSGIKTANRDHVASNKVLRRKRCRLKLEGRKLCRETVVSGYVKVGIKYETWNEVSHVELR